MDRFYYISACVVFGVVGLCIGSFLNVVVYRLPRGMNLAKPPSHCPNCGHKLAWYDNIPLLSFLILRAKCRYCGAPVSPRYFALELFNCLLWLFSALIFYPVSLWIALVYAFALSLLLCMAQCDAENLWIPDSLQLCLLLVAVCGVFLDPLHPWQDKIYGFLFGGCFFALFYFLSFPLFGREGMGFGDVKLMACVGLLLGWKQTFVAVVFGILSALVGIAVRRLSVPRKRQSALAGEGAEFAFAPYLAFGALCALFFADAVIAWYTALIA